MTLVYHGLFRTPAVARDGSGTTIPDPDNEKRALSVNAAGRAAGSPTSLSKASADFKTRATSGEVRSETFGLEK
jgi:hypothetical protein